MTAVRSRRVLEFFFKALFAFKGEIYMGNEIHYSTAKEQVEKLLSQFGFPKAVTNFILTGIVVV